MVNTQLLDYVKGELAKGTSQEVIRKNLAAAGGWKPEDVDEAFSIAASAAVSGVPPVANAVPTPGIKYAGFWIRWVAVVVDGLVLVIPIGLAQFILAAIGADGSAGYILQMIITWTYFSLMTHKRGATLGKMLVGITVKSDDLQKLSFGKILLRETVGKFISGIIFCIGYIMAGFTGKKQALHDYMAGSVVVYKDPSKPNKTGLIVGIVLAALLPIIAIIGILSAVVLASLSAAHGKASDAAIKANLNSIRASAELYYSENNNSYSVAHDCISGMFADPNVAQYVTGAAKNTVATCYAEGTSYAVSVSLPTSRSNYCVDNSGYVGSGKAVDDGAKAFCRAD